MRRANAKCLCLILLAGFAARAAEQQAVLDDYKKKSAELKELVARINDALPNGWHAEFSAESRVPTIEVTGDMVWQVAPVVGINDVFSLARIQEESCENAKWSNPKFSLRYEKFVTPEAFAVQAGKNLELKTNRERMQALLLEKKIDCEFRRDVTIPYRPDDFKPKTDEEKELVWQYRILVADYDLVSLPTHHWKNMSFDYQKPKYTSFKHEEDKAEFDSVKAKVLALLTAYEPPKDEEKKP